MVEEFILHTQSITHALLILLAIVTAGIVVVTTGLGLLGWVSVVGVVTVRPHACPLLVVAVKPSLVEEDHVDNVIAEGGNLCGFRVGEFRREIVSESVGKR